MTFPTVTKEQAVAALQFKEAEELQMKELNEALNESEKSGFVKEFNSNDYLKNLHSKF